MLVSDRDVRGVAPGYNRAMIRCPICGTSKFLPGETQCLRDRREAVGREDKCEIDEPTRSIVLQCSERLKDYDVTVTQQADGGLILDFQNPDSEHLLDDGALRWVVLLLWDNEVPPEQIRRLRLDEPQQIDAVIRHGSDSLRDGTGELTQAFRSFVRDVFQSRTGDRSHRLDAEAALRKDFKALVDAMDDSNWDDTDKRVYEIIRRFDDYEELPIWSQVLEAIAE